MPLNTTTQTHANILRVHSPRPLKILSVIDPQVKAYGSIWRGKFKPSSTEEFDLLALQSPESWAEVNWTEPTTIVGVQFAGNQDDGWGRILIDGESVWEGNTFGEHGKFNHYLEFSGLENSAHTVRVEATGRVGTEGGGIDVSLTAFGFGKVSADNMIDHSTKIFIPFAAS